MYFEGYSEYVKVYLQNNSFLANGPLHEIEKLLPKNLFLRIHKSYIISLLKVEGFSKQLVKISKKELPIGRTYKLEAVNTLYQS